MKKIKYIVLLAIPLFLLNNSYIKAEECTKEELDTLKAKADKIEITYKHLGEIEKEDGSKVYNEFMVTTKNLDGFYVYLSPMTEENFVELENGIQIKLTTGTWKYAIYSKECDTKIEEIEVNLPRFNIYSLDPLCDGVDSDEFSLCGKYYNYEVSRETFERKVNAYRKEKKIDEKDDKPEEKNNDIINKALEYLNKYYIYITVILSIILVIIIIAIIIRKKKQRGVLE